MRVAGDDGMGLCGECAGDDVIVVGVGSHHMWRVRGREQNHERAVVRRQGVGAGLITRQAQREFRISKRVRQFVEQDRAGVEFDLLGDCQVDERSR